MKFSNSNDNSSSSSKGYKKPSVELGCPQCLVHQSIQQTSTLSLSSESSQSLEYSYLPIYFISVIVEIHVSVAFICVRASFLNSTGHMIDGIFSYPTSYDKASIASCEIMFPDKVFSTVVMDSKEMKYPSDPSLQRVMDQMKTFQTSRNSNNANTTYSTYLEDDDILSNAKTFRMPFHSCPPNSEIIVELKYSIDMLFNAKSGDLECTVPLMIPSTNQPIYGNYSLDKVISILCKIYYGNKSPMSSTPILTLSDYNYKSHTHPLKRLETGESSVTIQSKSNTNSDFHISYNIWSDRITANCIVQPSRNENKSEKDGSFIVFLSPPSKHKAKTIPRNMIFLLDRSGSMYGEPMIQAKQALITALNTLDHEDTFAICSFNHSMNWFPASVQDTNKLIHATVSNINEAKDWTASIDADGGTNILKPYQMAYNILSNTRSDSSTSGTINKKHDSDTRKKDKFEIPLPPPGFNQPKYAIVTNQPSEMTRSFSIPTIVLITDGAVSDELDICEYAKTRNELQDKNQIESIRTFTFGIGPYCNQCFLKKLATIGRGYSDICLFPELVYPQMTTLMSKTFKPVLTSIQLNVVSSKSFLLYPDIIPDLCVGCPVMICGIYTGTIPSKMYVEGAKSDGTIQNFEIIPVLLQETFPLYHIICKRKVDMLICQWWYEQNQSKSKRNAIRQEAVSTAVEANIPCVFTSTIAYEDKSKSSKQSKQASIPSAKALPTQPKNLPVAYPVGIFSSDDTNPSGNTNSPTQDKNKNKNKNNSSNNSNNHRFAKTLAIDGAIVVVTAATTAFLFGSISATISNLSVNDAMNIISSIGFNGDIFSNLGVVFNQIDGIGGTIANFAISTAQTIGPDISHAITYVGSNIVSGSQTAYQDIESGVNQVGEEVAKEAPTLCSEIGNCLSNGCNQCMSCDLFGLLSTIFNFLWNLSNMTLSFIGNICGNCGDCCQSCCSFLFNGDAISSTGNICQSIFGLISQCGSCCSNSAFGDLLSCIGSLDCNQVASFFVCIFNAIGDIVNAVGGDN